MVQHTSHEAAPEMPPNISGGVCIPRMDSAHARTPGKLFVKRD